jgi:PIN domain nuclease of toxin-antitoxin system
LPPCWPIQTIEVFLSAVTSLEVAIKSAAGKLNLPKHPALMFRAAWLTRDCVPCPFPISTLWQLSDYPFIIAIPLTASSLPKPI